MASRISLPAVLVAALVLAFSVFPARAGDKLRIATEGAYPPFNYLDERGELAGFDVDIAKALCRAMAKDCEFSVVPWDGIIEGLEAGQYDAVVASMSYTPERAKRVEFTDKYYRTTSSFVAKRGAKLDVSPAGLGGRTVATQRATVHADYLAATYGAHITLRTEETLDQAFALLAAGKADVVLCNSLAALGFLRSPAGKEFTYLGDPLSERSLASTANIALRKGNIALRDAINKALEAIRLSGEYDQINQKYFPFNIY